MAAHVACLTCATEITESEADKNKDYVWVWPADAVDAIRIHETANPSHIMIKAYSGH